MVAATGFLLVEPSRRDDPDVSRSSPSSLAENGAVVGFLYAAWVEFHRTPIYDVMYDYVIFGGTVFYTMTAASVFVLRRTRPDIPRPYRTWGYPVTPIVYVVASLLLIYGMLANEKSRFESLAGVGIILLGLPAYFFFPGVPRADAHRPEDAS